MEFVALKISGLNRLAEEELKDALPPDSLVTSTAEHPLGSLPEPGIITAVVYLTSMSIAALAAWLAKKRNRKYLKAVSKRVHSDGTVEESSFEIDESSEDALEPKVLAQLKEWITAGSL